jgi:hypothetical protein
VTYSQPNAHSDLQLVTSSNVAQKNHAKNYQFSTRGRETGGGCRLSMCFFQFLSEYVSSAYRFCITYHVSLYTRMPSQNRILDRKFIYYWNGHEIPSFQSSQIPITMLQKATIKQHPTSAASIRHLSLNIRSVLIPYTSNLTVFLYPLWRFPPTTCYTLLLFIIRAP